MMRLPRGNSIVMFALASILRPTPSRSLLFVRPTQQQYTVKSLTSLSMAAPFVKMAAIEDIVKALKNPAATIIDARSVGEIEKDGYCKPSTMTCRWVHAEATMMKAPLLEAAAEAVLPDKNAPVVIYCGSGMRAITCKNVLEGKGYTQVFNAGGLGDFQKIVNGL